MSGLSSKVVDNKIVELDLKIRNKVVTSFASTIEEYKKIVNKDGVYSINIDINKFGDFINNKISSIEGASIEGFADFILEDKPIIRKPIVRKPITLPKIAPKVNFVKDGERGIGVLMMGSSLGFYSISKLNKDSTSINDIKIIIPKILLTKDYKIFLDFIFNVYLINLNKTSDNKIIRSNELDGINKVKSFVYLVFSKINSKKNPEVFFHNLLNMLVRGSVFLILTKRVNMDSSAKKILLQKLILNELLFFVPDDNCNMKPGINAFLKFEPTLCKIQTINADKKISKCEPCKKISKCEPCNKISDLNSDEISEYCPKNEEESMSQNNIVYWQTGSVVITVLFLVILFLYISKK